MIQAGAERRVRYPIEPVFQLVADVKAYPTYLPGWRAVEVTQAGATRWEVRQTVGLLGRTATFNSVAELDPPHNLAIRSNDGPFADFRLTWRLHALGETTTLVRAEIAVTLKSSLAERVASPALPGVLAMVMTAFEARAARVLS